VTEVARANGANAVYKGLAQAQASNGKAYLCATNFRSGRVEVYNRHFKPVELPGGLFVDPRFRPGTRPSTSRSSRGAKRAASPASWRLADPVRGPGQTPAGADIFKHPERDVAGLSWTSRDIIHDLCRSEQPNSASADAARTGCGVHADG
jgi:hypothetical protein